jgi:hypothetical protein
LIDGANDPTGTDTMKRLLCWLAPLILLAANCLPALAQDPYDPTVPEKGVHVPALEYTVAFLFVVAVLVILCKPARKA